MTAATAAMDSSNRLVRRAGRVLCTLGCLILLAAAGDGPAPDGAFLTDLVDIPLTAGLAEVTAERLVFDKPDGRIVHAAAAGKSLAAPDVIAFYRQTLPQLGWAEHELPQAEAMGRMMFVRDQEQLEITLETVYETLVVRFFLEPVP